MSDTDMLEISVVQGEDFSLQIFWTDDYNNPIPVSGPAIMDVKDGYGQSALRFITGQTDDTQPLISLNGSIGFLQMTCTKEVTADLLPGRYQFDLFASVADPSGPFIRQQQRVVAGYFVVEQRVSIVEEIPDYLSGQDVAP